MAADVNDPARRRACTPVRRLSAHEIVAGAGGASWRETWQSRELLRVMVWRDFTLRYKQTFVGAGWAILQPLGLTAVFAIFLGRVVPNPVDGLALRAVRAAGDGAVAVLPRSRCRSAGVSLSTNYDTVTKVFFPRLYLPLAMIVGGLIDLGVRTGRDRHRA